MGRQNTVGNGTNNKWRHKHWAKSLQNYRAHKFKSIDHRLDWNGMECDGNHTANSTANRVTHSTWAHIITTTTTTSTRHDTTWMDIVQRQHTEHQHYYGIAMAYKSTTNKMESWSSWEMGSNTIQKGMESDDMVQRQKMRPRRDGPCKISGNQNGKMRTFWKSEKGSKPLIIITM